MGRLLALWRTARPAELPVGDAAADPTLEAALETALAAAVASARAAWPAIELADESFVATLADKAGDGGIGALSALLVGDLYLASACAAGVLEALLAFERHLQAARPALRRVDASDAFADEVLQLVREKLFVWADGPPKITAYAGRGAIGSWTRVAVVRTGLNHKRGQGAPPVADDSEIVGGEGGGGDGDGVELGYLKSRYRSAFQAAFEAAMASLTAAERTLLRLHFVDGLALEQLAVVEQISRATAGRRLLELRRRLAADTRARLQAALHVDGRELESMVGLLQSQLMLSLSRILR